MTTKRPFGTQLEPEVLQALRSTVLGLQQLNPSLTVAEFVSRAITTAIRTAQDEYNDGHPWPVTAALPRRGPRIVDRD